MSTATTSPDAGSTPNGNPSTQPLAAAQVPAPPPAQATPPTNESAPDIKALFKDLTPEQRMALATGKTVETPASQSPANTPSEPAADGDPASPNNDPANPPPNNPPDLGKEGDEKSKLRARFTSDEDIAIVKIAKAKGVSLVEAARIFLEDKPAQPAAPAIPQEPAPAPIDPMVANLDQQLADSHAKIAQLQEQRAIANEELNQAEADRINDEIVEQRVLLVNLKRDRQSHVERAEADTRANVDGQISASRDRAVEKYPDLNNPKSVHKLAFIAYVDDAIAAAKSDPRRSKVFSDTDWPERLAEEYATEFEVKAAGSAPAPTPTNQTTPKPQPVPPAGKAPSENVRQITSSTGRGQPAASETLTPEDARQLLRTDPELRAAYKRQVLGRV